jgi:hypothetical protein
MDLLGLSSLGRFIYLPETEEEMTITCNPVNVTQPPSNSLQSDGPEQSLIWKDLFGEVLSIPPFTDVSSRPLFPEVSSLLMHFLEAESSSSMSPFTDASSRPLFPEASLMPPFTDRSSRPFFPEELSMHFPEADFNLDYFAEDMSDNQTYRMQLL